MENQVEEKKESSVKIISLKELGMNLALGVEFDQKLAKSVELAPWKMKQEKQLGEMAEDNPDANMGEFVSMVLSHMCKTLGAYNFEKLETPEKRIHISQMFMGDVFTAYCLLRKKALGKILPLEFKCPNCRKDITFQADLDTIEVKVANDVKDVEWEYELDEPIIIRNEKVTKFTLGPLRWNTIERIDGASAHMGVAKEQSIMGSVIRIDELGGPVMLTSGDIDELSKLDLETLSAMIEDKAIGPVMSIKDNCPKCRREFHKPIDWRYDSFFGVSSSQLKS